MHSELEAIQGQEANKVSKKEEAEADAHLRRAKEVIGYRVEGRDNNLGKVDDFVVDDENWDLSYFVLGVGNLESDKVLVGPFLIKWVRYDAKEVFIDLTEEVIKDSPLFDPKRPINRENEQILYDFYGRPYYSIKR